MALITKLVAYYKGNNFTDEQGSHDSSSQTATSLLPTPNGKYGGGWSLDDLNASWVDLDSTINFDQAHNETVGYTVSAWLKGLGKGSSWYQTSVLTSEACDYNAEDCTGRPDSAVMPLTIKGGYGGIYLGFESNGLEYGMDVNGDGNNGGQYHSTTTNTTPNSFDASTWYHFAVTVLSGEAKYYINGNHVATATDTKINNAAEFGRIGNTTDGWYSKTSVADGVDEVAVFNEALTPTEIGEIYGTEISLLLVDTTPPVITIIGDAALTFAQDASGNYIDAGATATDDIDGNITSSVVVSGDVVNLSVAGIYTITYDVMDSSMNPALQVTRIVTVETQTNSGENNMSTQTKLIFQGYATDYPYGAHTGNHTNEYYFQLFDTNGAAIQLYGQYDPNAPTQAHIDAANSADTSWAIGDEISTYIQDHTEGQVWLGGGGENTDSMFSSQHVYKILDAPVWIDDTQGPQGFAFYAFKAELIQVTSETHGIIDMTVANTGPGTGFDNTPSSAYSGLHFNNGQGMPASGMDERLEQGEWPEWVEWSRVEYDFAAYVAPVQETWTDATDGQVYGILNDTALIASLANLSNNVIARGWMPLHSSLLYNPNGEDLEGDNSSYGPFGYSGAPKIYTAAYLAGASLEMILLPWSDAGSLYARDGGGVHGTDRFSITWGDSGGEDDLLGDQHSVFALSTIDTGTNFHQLPDGDYVIGGKWRANIDAATSYVIATAVGIEFTIGGSGTTFTITGAMPLAAGAPAATSPYAGIAAGDYPLVDIMDSLHLDDDGSYLDKISVTQMKARLATLGGAAGYDAVERGRYLPNDFITGIKLMTLDAAVTAQIITAAERDLAETEHGMDGTQDLLPEIPLVMMIDSYKSQIAKLLDSDELLQFDDFSSVFEARSLTSKLIALQDMSVADNMTIGGSAVVTGHVTAATAAVQNNAAANAGLDVLLTTQLGDGTDEASRLGDLVSVPSGHFDVAGTSTFGSAANDATDGFGAVHAHSSVAVDPAGDYDYVTDRITIDIGGNLGVDQGSDLTVESGWSGETGLAAKYPLDTNANDSHGSNNGTLHGDADFTTDGDRTVLTLDGSGDYAEIPYSSALVPEMLTATTWVKFNNTASGYETILNVEGNDPGDNNYSYSIFRNAGGLVKGGLRIIQDSDGQEVGGTVTSSTVFAAGTWYHVALTFDGALTRLYVNGVLEHERNDLIGSVKDYHANPGDSSLLIGNAFSFDAGGEYLNGLIDEVRIWNRALLASEVAELHAGTETVDSALVLHADFGVLATPADLRVEGALIIGEEGGTLGEFDADVSTFDALASGKISLKSEKSTQGPGQAIMLEALSGKVIASALTLDIKGDGDEQGHYATYLNGGPDDLAVPGLGLLNRIDALGGPDGFIGQDLDTPFHIIAKPISATEYTYWKLVSAYDFAGETALVLENWGSSSEEQGMLTDILTNFHPEFFPGTTATLAPTWSDLNTAWLTGDTYLNDAVLDIPTVRGRAVKMLSTLNVDGALTVQQLASIGQDAVSNAVVMNSTLNVDGISSLTGKFHATSESAEVQVTSDLTITDSLVAGSTAEGNVVAHDALASASDSYFKSTFTAGEQAADGLTKATLGTSAKSETTAVGAAGSPVAISFSDADAGSTKHIDGSALAPNFDVVADNLVSVKSMDVSDPNVNPVDIIIKAEGDGTSSPASVLIDAASGLELRGSIVIEDQVDVAGNITIETGPGDPPTAFKMQHKKYDGETLISTREKLTITRDASDPANPKAVMRVMKTTISYAEQLADTTDGSFQSTYDDYVDVIGQEGTDLYHQHGGDLTIEGTMTVAGNVMTPSGEFNAAPLQDVEIEDNVFVLSYESEYLSFAEAHAHATHLLKSDGSTPAMTQLEVAAVLVARVNAEDPDRAASDWDNLTKLEKARTTEGELMYTDSDGSTPIYGIHRINAGHAAGDAHTLHIPRTGATPDGLILNMENTPQGYSSLSDYLAKEAGSYILPPIDITVTPTPIMALIDNDGDGTAAQVSRTISYTSWDGNVYSSVYPDQVRAGSIDIMNKMQLDGNDNIFTGYIAKEAYTYTPGLNIPGLLADFANGTAIESFPAGSPIAIFLSHLNRTLAINTVGIPAAPWTAAQLTMAMAVLAHDEDDVIDSAIEAKAVSGEDFWTGWTYDGIIDWGSLGWATPLSVKGGEVEVRWDQHNEWLLDNSGDGLFLNSAKLTVSDDLTIWTGGETFSNTVLKVHQHDENANSYPVASDFGAQLEAGTHSTPGEVTHTFSPREADVDFVVTNAGLDPASGNGLILKNSILAGHVSLQGKSTTPGALLVSAPKFDEKLGGGQWTHAGQRRTVHDLDCFDLYLNDKDIKADDIKLLSSGGGHIIISGDAEIRSPASGDVIGLSGTGITTMFGTAVVDEEVKIDTILNAGKQEVNGYRTLSYDDDRVTTSADRIAADTESLSTRFANPLALAELEIGKLFNTNNADVKIGGSIGVNGTGDDLYVGTDVWFGSGQAGSKLASTSTFRMQDKFTDGDLFIDGDSANYATPDQPYHGYVLAASSTPLTSLIRNGSDVLKKLTWAEAKAAGYKTQAEQDALDPVPADSALSGDCLVDIAKSCMAAMDAAAGMTHEEKLGAFYAKGAEITLTTAVHDDDEANGKIRLEVYVNGKRMPDAEYDIVAGSGGTEGKILKFRRSLERRDVITIDSKVPHPGV